MRWKHYIFLSNQKMYFFDLLHKIHCEDIQRFDKLFNLVESMLSKDPTKRPDIKGILDESISYYDLLTSVKN